MAPVRWWSKRLVVPPRLQSALGRDERVLAAAGCTDGTVLAASRFGLWVADERGALRWGWEVVTRARLTAKVLTLTPAAVLEHWHDGTAVLADLPPQTYPLADASGLTDVVHARVRRSVAASRHLPWPGAGGWVVLRRVPGRDGVTRQVRIDPGADPGAPGFAEAVARTAGDLESG